MFASFSISSLVQILQSLGLAAMVGFALPLLALGSLLGFAAITCFIPGLHPLAWLTLQKTVTFLEIFGGGSPVQGAIALGLAGAAAIVLLDSFVLYQNRNWQR